ncbi:hypothetical protein TraAM80_07261 [Trypanosoma rangeli]|uniref:Uncharacterized protein n=1 Tax=Trypanosoma rangeli TaxID=5698 RepID=A0A422N6D6_TRYRA|nr:uncharacterized protein TraAM80_07261 [Trypanosoma rangeli]RNF01047.1 hypothetical protein TraAM80_07261 [Trypanosoma rangeli]|eukprot:RNF01047.1 hypothetical protein TraAM80_07261 [Trypanosoma rangeli]
MCNSPILVNQRACPSFFTPQRKHSAESLTNGLNGMPLSLRGVVPDDMFLGGDTPASFTSFPSPPSARRRGRSNREVLEAMLRSDAIAAERKEESRRMALQQELSQCRPAPRISAIGQNLPRDADVFERLGCMHEEKQRVGDLKRREWEQQQSRDMERCFVPNITGRGHYAEGRALQETEEYPQRRQQREKEMVQLAEVFRHRRLAEEIAELCASPKINLRSEDIVRRARERSGGDERLHVDSILERRAIAQLALWERHERREVEALSFNPRITAHAAGLKHNGMVVERLSSSAKATNPRQGEDTRQARSEPRLRFRTAGHPFQRKQNRNLRGTEVHPVQQRNPSRKSIDSRTTSMEERQRQYKIRREEKIRAVFEAERRLHTPAINPISEMISANLPVSSAERLMISSTRGDNGVVQASDSSSVTPGCGSFCLRARNVIRCSGANAHDDGPEEYVLPSQFPSWANTRVSQTRGKEEIYERALRWKQRRDDKVQGMRTELHEEKTWRSMQSAGVTQKADKDVKDTPTSPNTCCEKQFLDSYVTPRAPTGMTEGTRTPDVLSLRRITGDERC